MVFNTHDSALNMKQEEADGVLNIASHQTLAALSHRAHEGKLQQHACLSARNRFSLTVG